MRSSVREFPTFSSILSSVPFLLCLASCSGQAADPQQSGVMPPFVPGQGGEQSFGGASGAPAVPIGSPGAGGSGGATPVGGGAGNVGGAGAVPPAATPDCPTYVDDFVPSINTPVCSKCHGVQSKLPNWGVYSTAKASCSAIGSRVASGSMPPRSSGTLTAEQRTLVADWVRLGCPQAESNLPASCFPPPPQGAGGSANPPPQGAGGTSTIPPQGMGGTSTSPPQGTGGAITPGSGGATNPPTGAMLSITRAEWDAENQSLRLEGRCSDYSATLRADFAGRMEPLTNDTGRFRNVFNNVATDPMSITVTASNGVAATSAVQVK